LNKNLETPRRLTGHIASHVISDIESNRPLMRLEDVIDDTLNLSERRLKHGFVHRGNGNATEFYALLELAISSYRRVYLSYEAINTVAQELNSSSYTEPTGKEIAIRAWWDRSLSFLDQLEGWCSAKAKGLSPDEFLYSDPITVQIIEEGLESVLGPDLLNGPINANTGEVVWNNQNNDNINKFILGSFISLMETYG